MAWAPVAESEPIRAGETYRFLGTLKAPYNAATTTALRITYQTELALKGYTFVRLDHAAPLFDEHSGGMAPWPFIVTFRTPSQAPPVAAGFDGRTLLALAVTIVVIAVSIRTVGGRLEKLVTTVGGESRKTLNTVLNPGTLILIVLAIAIIYGVVAKKGA